MEDNMKNVTKNSIVTLRYSVSDQDGNMVDEGKEPLQYLHGGYDGIFVSIENALDGKRVGDSVTVTLQPAEAFGEYDPDLVNIMSVDELPQPVTIGMVLEGNEEGDGKQGTIIARVTDIADDRAVVDANHPLAGMILVFSCTVLSVRPATAEELGDLSN